MNTSFGAMEATVEGNLPLPAWTAPSGQGYLHLVPPPLSGSAHRRESAAASLWRRALLETGEKRLEGEDFRLGLVYLKSWPDIPNLPEDVAASVTRVCALLSHKPTVGFLVGKVLDLGEEEARRLLLVLHRFGHIDVLQRKSAADLPQASDPGIAAAPPAQSAFLGKLWKKLITR